MTAGHGSAGLVAVMAVLDEPDGSVETCSD